MLKSVAVLNYQFQLNSCLIFGRHYIFMEEVFFQADSSTIHLQG